MKEDIDAANRMLIAYITLDQEVISGLDYEDNNIWRPLVSSSGILFKQYIGKLDLTA